MTRPTVQHIHKNYNLIDLDIRVSIIQQYSPIHKQWKFYGYRCLHCDSPFKSIGRVQQHKTVCKELNTTNKKETEVPIQVITIKGERYYRYGDSGKPYKNRADAEKQAQAIHASGYKEPKKDMKQK